MAAVEQVRIARDNTDGKGHYTIINKRDMKDSDVLWDQDAHEKMFHVKPANTSKKKAVKIKKAK